MVLKHVEISPCLRLLSVARGSCLIDLVFGVFVQNYGAGLSCKILFRYFHEFVKHKKNRGGQKEKKKKRRLVAC